MQEIICQICKRNTPENKIERHHLIPKTKGGAKLDCINVCCNCGDMLHKLFENKQLAKEYNTLEKILANEDMQKWVKWISKKDDFSICMKNKKRR